MAGGSVATGVAAASLELPAALALLATAEVRLAQRLPWSSNGTWLAHLDGDGASAYAVYKPRRQERPLWDFPRGTLCRRETAAFVVSAWLGWNLVPPTVLRDGPLGLGSLQLFVAHDPEAHFLTLDHVDTGTLHRLVALDVVINNADRKSGHVLAGSDGTLWAIDHGVTFHVEPKLRTVIWDVAGQRLPSAVVADLAALAAELDPGSASEATVSTGDVRSRLLELLSPSEVDALAARIRRLVTSGVFPGSDPRRRAVPWPLV